MKYKIRITQFIGVGETLEKLEPFYPDRMASRILGMVRASGC